MFPVIPRVNNNYLFYMFSGLAVIYALNYLHSKQHLFVFRMVHRVSSIYFYKPSDTAVGAKFFE
jgi:hypothetical protein